MISALINFMENNPNFTILLVVSLSILLLVIAALLLSLNFLLKHLSPDIFKNNDKIKTFILLFTSKDSDYENPSYSYFYLKEDIWNLKIKFIKMSLIIASIFILIFIIAMNPVTEISHLYSSWYTKQEFVCSSTSQTCELRSKNFLGMPVRNIKITPKDKAFVSSHDFYEHQYESSNGINYRILILNLNGKEIFFTEKGNDEELISYFPNEFTALDFKDFKYEESNYFTLFLKVFCFGIIFAFVIFLNHAINLMSIIRKNKNTEKEMEEAEKRGF